MDSYQRLLFHHSDTMPSVDITYEWVEEHGYWRSVDEQEALRVLADAGMLPEVTQEEVPS